jgi:hypothetical protein
MTRCTPDRRRIAEGPQGDRRTMANRSSTAHGADRGADSRGADWRCADSRGADSTAPSPRTRLGPRNPGHRSHFPDRPPSPAPRAVPGRTLAAKPLARACRRATRPNIAEQRRGTDLDLDAPPRPSRNLWTDARLGAYHPNPSRDPNPRATRRHDTTRHDTATHRNAPQRAATRHVTTSRVTPLRDFSLRDVRRFVPRRRRVISDAPRRRGQPGRRR